MSLPYLTGVIVLCVMNDLQKVYDNMFVNSVHSVIEQSIPVRRVRLGHKDPAFLTPLIKVLLRRRSRLRRRGRVNEADTLAVRSIRLFMTSRVSNLNFL